MWCLLGSGLNPGHSSENTESEPLENSLVLSFFCFSVKLSSTSILSRCFYSSIIDEESIPQHVIHVKSFKGSSWYPYFYLPSLCFQVHHVRIKILISWYFADTLSSQRCWDSSLINIRNELSITKCNVSLQLFWRIHAKNSLLMPVL